MKQGAIQKWQWIVQDRDTLGGAPRIKGTRLSVAFVLDLLSSGVSVDEIADEFPPFPKECIPDVLKFAALKVAGKEPNVAA